MTETIFDQMLFELLTEIIPQGLVQDHAPGTEKLDRLRAIVGRYIQIKQREDEVKPAARVAYETGMQDGFSLALPEVKETEDADSED